MSNRFFTYFASLAINMAGNVCETRNSCSLFLAVISIIGQPNLNLLFINELCLVVFLAFRIEFV